MYKINKLMQSKIQEISGLSRSEIEKYVLKTSLQKLQNMKLYLDDVYYNTGESSGLTDSQYDIFNITLRKRDPTAVAPVGAKIREGENRVKLPIWLGSMDKYYPEEASDIAKWQADNQADRYIVEDKLDGVSCLIIIKERRVKMYTRGDGFVGADISYLAQYLQDTIPVDNDVTLRGELMIKRSVFDEKHSEAYANPRNMVTGLLGTKKVKEAFNDVDFIAYEIIGDGEMLSPSKQLSLLDSFGFKTVGRSYIDEVSVSTLESLLVERNMGNYEIDGLIVQADSEYERNTSGNPDYAFAFKMVMEGDKHETTVIEVEWNISKWGVFKPRIKIEPVQFKGSVVSYTSGFNANFIVEKGIGPGAIVTMILSGQVIPFIYNVKDGVEPQLPDVPYRWNKTHIDIYAENAGEIMCVKLISHFFAKLGIKHVSEATVSSLYLHGYDTLLKIVGASASDFEKVDTFQKSRAERTYNNIHSGLQNVEIHKVLGASGVFGYGIGVRKVNALLTEMPDVFELYRDLSREEFLERVTSVEGFAEKSARRIVKNVPYAEAFYLAMLPYTTFKDSTRSSDSLKGKQFVMTGFRDAILEAEIVDRGGKILSSVSKKTTCLIVANKTNNPSGKHKNAIEKGVPVFTKEEFTDEFLS